MSRTIRQNASFVAVLLCIAAAGSAAAIKVLLQERLPNPFANTYSVQIALTAADGVVPGYGQPVEVAGVPVGMISKTRLSGGTALLTLSINRSDLTHVYRNATADLEPVTPLKDMEVDLDPGTPGAGVLGPHGLVPVAATTSPVELEDLLQSLDGDTRAYLSSLITALGTGLGGQGSDIRHLITTLGPTATQLRSISVAMDSRRHDIASLVHNLSVLTRAAADRGQLETVVKAGDQTLHAVADQDGALQQSVSALPGTLRSVQSALGSGAQLAHSAAPTLAALLPVVKRLPSTLETIGPFAGSTATTLSRQIRPLIRTAVPALGQLAPAVDGLVAAAPSVKGIAQVLDYTLNELAYNPGKGDPGMLFWFDWAAHNVNSAAGNEDANGAIVRSLLVASCQQLTDSANLGGLLADLLHVNAVCSN